MNENATAIETLFERARIYTSTSVELAALRATGKIADAGAGVVMRLVIAIVVAVFVLMLNIAIGIWVGELTGKLYYGFFLLAAFYALLLLVLYVFRNQWIKLPISNSIIDLILKKEVKADDEQE